MRAAACCALIVMQLLVPAVANAGGRSADTAALQVALRAKGLYDGTVDGVRGPGTQAAVRAFQRRAGLAADGVAGAGTRRALGRRGRPSFGARVLQRGAHGWDVAALQFKLAWHGFPSGTIDGGLGDHTVAAIVRFQRWAGLPADGVAGRGTQHALQRPVPASPVRLLRPVAAPVGDRFGNRGDRFHAGLDFPAAVGVPVTAAGFGTVAFAGYNPSGWGNMVIVRHRFGLRTLYAHLSSIAVRRGQHLGAGARLGSVGATGHAIGPHLHFEVLLRGANVDPAGALGR